MIDTQALRKKILDAAISGKLTQQLPGDGNADDLYKEIQIEKQKLIKESELKKEKPLPEIAEKDIPFDIPKNWEWVRFGAICSKLTDGSHNPPPKATAGYRVISAKNIKNGRIEFVADDRFSSEADFERENKRTQIKKGDLILGIIGGSIGNTAIYNHEEKVIAQRSIAIISAFVPSLYVLIFLNSGFAQHFFTDESKGSAQGGIYLGKLNSMLFPLPTLAEQKRIVSMIETIFAQLDLIDEEQKKLADNSITLRNKLIELGIRGKLTEQLASDGDAETLYAEIQKEKQRLTKEGKIKKEKPLPEITKDDIPFDIPETWKWVRLNAVGLDFADGPFGSNLKKEHYTDNPEVRIIQLSNIGEYGWRDENVKFTTYKHRDSIIRSKVDPGDIVIAKMMPAGRAIIVPELGTGFVLSSDAIKVVPSTYIDVRFLLYAINSNVFRDQIYSEVQGTTRVRTSLAKVRGYLIPLPPLAEQNRIVEKLDQLLPLCDAMSSEIAGGDSA